MSHDENQCTRDGTLESSDNNLMLGTSEVENTGSQARDFCMLERNLLSHVKLALLLAVLSWSILLKSRLVPGQPENENNSDIPFSAAEYGTALACIVAGIWEYYKGYNDLRTSTPFFKGTK